MNEFIVTLQEFNGAVYTQQADDILKQAVLGVVNHGIKGKKGKVILTISIVRHEDEDGDMMVDVEHAWAFEYPTKRGKKTETNSTSTTMYPTATGGLSVFPPKHNKPVAIRPSAVGDN
jgi:hypothetical protein